MPNRSLPALVAIVVLAAFNSAVPRAVAQTPPLDELLAEYQRRGLPLPPKEAKLVRYEISFSNADARGRHHPIYALAFLIKPGSKTGKAVVLHGTRQWEPFWRGNPQEIEPDPAVLKEFQTTPDDDLVQAIQCHHRRWNELATFLFDRSQRSVQRSPKRRLAEIAWTFRDRQLYQPDVDRSVVARAMKELIDSEDRLDTAGNRALLYALELALVPSTAKAGSVEAAIDALVDLSRFPGVGPGYPGDDRYVRIVRMGFDAVPALIDHLNDDRLTRAGTWGPGSYPSWHLRINEVVSDLLDGLAAEKLPRGSDDDDMPGVWFRPQRGYPIRRRAAQVWWERARLVGEEAYLLAHVLPEAGPDGERNHVCEHPFRVIAAKYPQHIPALYRKVLDERPDIRSETLVEAVVESKLPAPGKLAVVLRGAEHKDYDHRFRAMTALSKLDRAEFTTRLSATLEGLPKDVDREYWTCPEARFARLVLGTKDPLVWATLEKVARRSALGLRMELLHRLCYADDMPRRKERLRLLGRFLDDATLRDRSADKRFEGPGAGFPYPRIEVRNFVAVELGELLGIPIEVDFWRTPAEWAAVRSRVREALQRDLGEKE
jgi:hypothetical protein